MPNKNIPDSIFQNFEQRSDASTVLSRVAALRTELTAQKLNAFLVPRADVHRGENVPARDERLSWLTAFTGSAGLAVVAEKKAVLLVDGRYTLQAPDETNIKVFDVAETPTTTLSGWLLENLPQGARIGFDPWLHTPTEIDGLKEKLGSKASLVPVENLVDHIWTDRPDEPKSAIEFLGTNRAGKTATDKLDDLRKTIAAAGADAVVLTLPESICWLFNIRGRDVPNTPFVLGFAIVPAAGQPQLFLPDDKLTAETKKLLGPIADLHPKAAFADGLKQMGDTPTVWIDPATAPQMLTEILRDAGAKIVRKQDPTLLPKAAKNETEIAGMREAQYYDAIAMAKFLAWFEEAGPKGGLTEIDIAKQLEAFRREEETTTDISFGTISGAGAHGAVVHYQVNEKTNRTLVPGEIMLVDSGAQYLSGTTDITRTMASGPVTSEQKDRFTRVLKGMIAISRARFPKGSSGAQLDTLARQALWDIGLNYNHGTGHGVGHFLNVHEGPVGISPRAPTPLSAGNILSNEPGYYKTGEYGIRIENLILVIQSPEHKDFYEFETLTFTPIDKRLIEVSLLTAAELEWLNSYHAEIWQKIGNAVEGNTKTWLRAATNPITT